MCRFLAVGEAMTARSLEPSVERVMDEAAWSALWARHDPSSRPPKVDFNTAMVVAIFKGSVSSLVSGLRLDSVLDKAELEVMTGVFIGDVLRGQTNAPYLFVVLPRSTKAIMVVEHSVGMMMHPRDNYSVIGRLEAIR